MTSFRYVLGSQSPRRRELLGALVGVDNVDVIPPLDGDEPGFDGLTDWDSIEQQLYRIALEKLTDVSNQIANRQDDIVIAADTVIVAIDQNEK